MTLTTASSEICVRR